MLSMDELSNISFVNFNILWVKYECDIEALGWHLRSTSVVGTQL